MRILKKIKEAFERFMDWLASENEKQFASIGPSCCNGKTKEGKQ